MLVWSELKRLQSSTEKIGPVDLMYFTDPHLSLRPPVARTEYPFYQVFLEKMAYAVTLLQPETIICGGDIYHTGNPHWSVVAAFMQMVLQSAPSWVMVPGNHDLINWSLEGWEKTPYGLLASLPGHDRFTLELGVAEQTVHIGDRSIYLMSGSSHTDTRLFERREIAEARGADIVVVHGSIGDHPTIATILPENIFGIFPDARVILSGHIHSAFVAGSVDRKRWCANPGPIVRRTTAERDGTPKVLYIRDLSKPLTWGENINFLTLPHAPADEWKDVTTKARLHDSIISLQGVIEEVRSSHIEPVDDDSFQRLLDGYLQAMPASLRSEYAISAEALEMAVKLFVETERGADNS